MCLARNVDQGELQVGYPVKSTTTRITKTDVLPGRAGKRSNVEATVDHRAGITSKRAAVGRKHTCYSRLNAGSLEHLGDQATWPLAYHPLAKLRCLHKPGYGVIRVLTSTFIREEEEHFVLDDRTADAPAKVAKPSLDSLRRCAKNVSKLVERVEAGLVVLE